MPVSDSNWSCQMVDPDLLRRKVAQVLHHVARLRRHVSISPQDLRGNEDLYNGVLMDLQQAIQGCLDLALHACVDDKLGAPTSAAEAFALLVRAGYIDEALKVRLVGAAGLRNLIVHQYFEIDAGKILTVLRNDLGDLELFASRMRSKT
jgi:uncharacterized protein YutE (UPF0331/DUF86 family)